MTWSLGFACIWALISTIVALLPMRFQYAPGLTLLLLAPVLLVWIAYDHGWWIGALGVLAFVSMFRYPLRYIFRRLTGQNPQLPK
jgi:hypothetical protein